MDTTHLGRGTTSPTAMGSCGGGGGLSGSRNGEGILGQFDEKWGREVNKAGYGAIFFEVQCTEMFWHNCWRPFFLILMSS
jgi:hypothetical protein